MLKRIFPIVLTGMLLYACSDFEKSDNGELDGLWQLTTVDTLATGHSADVRALGIFWAVQADLLEIRDAEYANVFFRFDHDGSVLTLHSPVADSRPSSDRIVADAHELYRFGLSNLTDTLLVLELKKSKMTLQSELLRMHFRKY